MTRKRESGLERGRSERYDLISYQNCDEGRSGTMDGHNDALLRAGGRCTEVDS
jgi:hypothetical protein